MLSNKSIKQLTDHLYHPVMKEVATDDRFLDLMQDLIHEKIGDHVGAMDQDEQVTIAIIMLERVIERMY